jgi:hypothetical protein
VAVPVEDAAALGGEVYGSHPLVQAELRVALAPDCLEIDETRADRDECDHQRREQRHQASPGRAGTRPPSAQLRLTPAAPSATSRELVAPDLVRGAARTPERRRQAIARHPVHRAPGLEEERPHYRLPGRRRP